MFKPELPLTEPSDEDPTQRCLPAFDPCEPEARFQRGVRVLLAWLGLLFVLLAVAGLLSSCDAKTTPQALSEAEQNRLLLKVYRSNLGRCRQELERQPMAESVYPVGAGGSP